jgi:hypothetical protein
MFGAGGLAQTSIGARTKYEQQKRQLVVTDCRTPDRRRRLALERHAFCSWFAVGGEIIKKIQELPQNRESKFCMRLVAGPNQRKAEHGRGFSPDLA